MTTITTDASPYLDYHHFHEYIIHRNTIYQLHQRSEDTTIRRLLHYHGIRTNIHYKEQVQSALDLLKQVDSSEGESRLYQSGAKDRPVAWLSSKIRATTKVVEQLQKNVERLELIQERKGGGGGDGSSGGKEGVALREQQEKLLVFKQR